MVMLCFHFKKFLARSEALKFCDPGGKALIFIWSKSSSSETAATNNVPFVMLVQKQ